MLSRLSRVGLWPRRRPRVLVFHLTQRGFYSEFSNMVNAYIFAAAKAWGFSLVSQRFLYGIDKGWEDYFARFWIESDGKRVECRGKSPMFDQIRSFDYSNVSVPEMGLFPNQVFANKRKIARKLYQLLPSVEADVNQLIAKLNLPSDYVAIHIRRGDKVGEAPFRTNRKTGSSEAQSFPVEAYLNRLLVEPEAEPRHIFVCTDSYAAFLELQNHARDAWRDPTIYTLASPTDKGHSTLLLRQQFKNKYQAVVRLLADVKICTKSRRFVGTYSSNLSRLVPLLHDQPDRCHSLDIDWTHR